MTRLYSAQTGCCYIFCMGQLPADAIEIPDDVYDAVIRNPEPGKVRVHDSRGVPALADPGAPVLDLPALEREWRDAELAALVWLRDRHRDQLEIGAVTTLTAEQFSELLVFMQALRDWPQSEAFPDSSARPVPPAFIEQVGGEQ